MTLIRADISYLEREIDDYYSSLDVNFTPQEKGLVIEITKKILFFKIIFQGFDKDNTHYKKCLIYDSLMAMHAIKRKSINDYYNTQRSFIENYIRVMLRLKDDDETRVFKMFDKFKRLIDDGNIYCFFEYVYADGCNYVHSNIKANRTIYEYYLDIVTCNELEGERRVQIISELEQLMDMCVKTFIMIYANEVEDIFYRKKYELKFLFSKECYDLFEKQIKNRV